ncbi:hypothetical protein ACWPMX_06335 [Tsuneonella sp. HG094]
MLSLVFFTAATSASIVNPVDVMANIRAEHQLCSNPDVENKTCSALATYTLREDGAVVERVEMLLAPTAPISMELTGPLFVRGQKTCGALSADALSAVTYRVNGEPASAEQLAAIKPRVEAAMEPMIGRRACDEFLLIEGVLNKQGSVEGIDVVVPAKPIAWVKPSEGYSVAPKG